MTEISEKAFANAKDKGFWDRPQDIGEKLMLIVSELGEALEAHRKGKTADLAPFLYEYKAASGDWDEGLKHNFEGHIKDSWQDELADVAIRIGDLMGGFGLMPAKGMKYQSPIHVPANFGAALWNCNVYLVEFWSKHIKGMKAEDLLMRVVIALDTLMEREGYSLEQHIQLKMQYNATRERLHGKTY